MYHQILSMKSFFIFGLSILSTSCILNYQIEDLNSIPQEQPKISPSTVQVTNFQPVSTSTTKLTVDLNILAENASEMLISTNPDCSPSTDGWEIYKTNKLQWPLSFPGTVNQIYIKVRNTDKEESACVKTEVSQVIQTNPVSLISLDEADTSQTTSPNISFTYSSTGNTLSLSNYEYSVGDSLNSSNIKNWTSLGLANTFQVSGLSLTVGTTYYINLRAKDTGGHYSSITSSPWKVVNSVSVLARFAAAPNWNDYVKKSNTTLACASTDANYYACFHGGEKKEVSVTGETSCTNIEAYDTLSVFTWSCVAGSPIKMISKEVKPGKGLKDLVNDTSWKNNKVIIKKAGVPIAASSLSAWWTNTVLPLPDNSTTTQVNLATASAIYTLSTTRSTMGYNITADKIAVVTIGNSKLIANPLSTDPMFNTTNKHFWLEGYFAGTFYENSATHYFLITNGSTMNIINNSKIEGFYFGIYSVFQKSVIKSTRVINTRMFMYASGSSNIHVRDSIFQSEIESFSNQSGSSNVVIANNYFSGGTFTGSRIDFSSSANMNVSFNTMSSSINLGFGSGVNIHNILAPNNTAAWLYASLANNITISNYISDLLNVANASATNIKFSGLISYNTTCLVSSSVGISTACSLIAPSNGTLISGLDISRSSPSGNTLVGFVTSDTNHPSYTATGMKFSDITNWIQFDRPSRIWVNSSKARCVSNETCYIYDYALSSLDTLVLNKSGTLSSLNSSFPTNPAANCPAEVHGNQVITDLRGTPQNYLKNAYEIIDDELGDDDGLCESNEACVYAPNIGAYQGHGDYTTHTCTFQNGTVTGVSMYAYPYNGYSD